MSIESIVFDPDGDLVLRLYFPADDGPPTPSSTSTAGSAASADLGFSYLGTQKEVEMIVSSRHMILASPVFKAMLRGDFQEGKALESTGKAEVPLPDDDPGPFEILLNIIHGLFNKVPNKIDEATLRSLAILVDKYRVKQTLSLYVDKIWMPQLISSLPKRYAPNLFLWLDIAWVFDMSAEFNRVTKILVRESPDDISVCTEDVSLIPEKVLTNMSLQRRDTMAAMLSAIQDLLNASMASWPVSPQAAPSHNRSSLSCICEKTDLLPGGDQGFQELERSAACNSMMFGMLLQSAASVELYPQPSAPYVGLDIETLAQKVQSLGIVSLCDLEWREDRHSIPSVDEDAHGQQKYLIDQMAICMTKVVGLDLDTYPRPY